MCKEENNSNFKDSSDLIENMQIYEKFLTVKQQLNQINKEKDTFKAREA